MWCGQRLCSMPRVLGTTQYVQRSLQPWITFTQAVTSESRRATAGCTPSAARSRLRPPCCDAWGRRHPHALLPVPAVTRRLCCQACAARTQPGRQRHTCDVLQELGRLGGNHLRALVHPLQQGCDPAGEVGLTAAPAAHALQRLGSRHFAALWHEWQLSKLQDTGPGGHLLSQSTGEQRAKPGVQRGALVGVLGPHHQVQLWHASQQGGPLLLRHTASDHQLDVCAALALALRLRHAWCEPGASSTGPLPAGTLAASS